MELKVEKKTQQKGVFRSQLVTSFKRTLEQIGAWSISTSNSRVPAKGLTDSMLTYEERRETEAAMAEFEAEKARLMEQLRSRYY